ncbi:MAG: TonB-dependent receptor [Bacteroidetes bacterium]|nr:MAG: TonB-dependent receptor [Bacteroidota bacterium]
MKGWRLKECARTPPPRWAPLLPIHPLPFCLRFLCGLTNSQVNMLQRYACFWVFFLLLPALYGQADTTYTLNPIELTASRIRGSGIGERIESWTASQLAPFAHAADLLSRESGIFVKSYGLGSLATTSVRGGSASHTAILWNGLALDHPMLGQMDLSLLPLDFSDEVRLTYGGNTALWGNGAIGGVLSLHNRPHYQQGWLAEAGGLLGSFGRLDLKAKASYGGKRFSASTAFVHRQAQNNFPYHIQPGLPLKRQQHAAIRQQAYFQQVYWKPAAHQQLALHLWWQQAHRQIPPTTTQRRSQAAQADALLRTALHWQRAGTTSLLQARLGFFREQLRYTDALIGLVAPSHFWTATGELSAEGYLNEKQHWTLGLNHRYTRAEANGYAQPHAQQHSALFAAFRQRWRSWQLQLSARQALVDGRLAPLVPALAAEGQLWPLLQLKLKLSRNYRLPTLNDRYWQPGGQPDLLPESGWSQEVGLHLKCPLPKGQLRASLTAFNRYLHNWILWSIGEGQRFWSANNIAQVWSRGLEPRLQADWQLGTCKLQLTAGYDLVRSTNEKAIEQPRIPKGTQLIYTPRHRAFAVLGVQWKQWELKYSHRFTGGVSTLSDPLPAYQLGDLWLGRALSLKQWSAFLSFQVENVGNVHYRAIERRPMPGRHFLLGLNLRFHPQPLSSILSPHKQP